MKYKIIFYNDYYDGPISGLVIYEGKECYFRMFSNGGWLVDDFYTDNDDEWREMWMPRVYQVVDTPKWFVFKSKIIRWLFLRMVKNKHYKSLSSKIFYKLINGQSHIKLNRSFVSNLEVIGAFSDNEYSIKTE